MYILSQIDDDDDSFDHIGYIRYCVSYLDLASLARLRTDGRHHFSRPIGHIQRAISPAADLNVSVLLFVMSLIVHDVVPTGWIAVGIELNRFRSVRETHIQQMILFF